MATVKSTIVLNSLSIAPEIKHQVIIGATILLLLFTQARLNQNLSRIDLAWIEPPAEGNQKLDPELFRILSFGNLPMIVDSLTIKVLGDPSMDKVAKGTHPFSYFYLEAIAELDPLFSEIVSLANMLTVIRGDGQGARNLLEKSQGFVKNHLPEYTENFRTKYWPQPWLGEIFLGYVNIFELEDLPRGAEAFRRAAAMPGAPSYLHRLEQKLARPGGEYEVGVNLLNFMIKRAKDDRYQDALRIKLRNLSVAQFLFQTNLNFQKFLISLPRSPLINHLKKDKLPALWAKFLTISHTPALDPWGGRLYLNDTNKIVTTTPYEKVFGLN